MKKLSYFQRGEKTGEPARFFLFIIFLFFSIFSESSAQIWEDFTVWYDGNGADSGYISAEHFKSGTNIITLKMNAASAGSSDVPYTKNGCIFAGWCLYPDGDFAVAPLLSEGFEWDPKDVPVTWTENKDGFVFYARWDCDGNYNGIDDPIRQRPTQRPAVPTAVFIPGKTSVPFVPTPTASVTATPIPTALFNPYEVFGGSASAGDDIDSKETKSADKTDTPFVVIPFAEEVHLAESSPERVMLSQNMKSVQDLEPYSADQQLLIIPDDIIDENTVIPIPAAFTAPIEYLETLPNTGITSKTGSRHGEKSLSVSYTPANMELMIPGLDLSSSIVSVERSNGGYALEQLGNNIALLADMADPGKGISILAAHNTLDEETFGPFAMIHSLQIGDRFFIRTEKNELMSFEIYSNLKINEYDFETLYRTCFLYDNTVTLLTCEDERPEGGYANRRIVSAKLVN